MIKPRATSHCLRLTGIATQIEADLVQVAYSDYLAIALACDRMRRVFSD
jgi:hypothetical protein